MLLLVGYWLLRWRPTAGIERVEAVAAPVLERSFAEPGSVGAKMT